MSQHNKFDFLETVGDAFGSLFGRLFSVFLAYVFGCGLAAVVHANPEIQGDAATLFSSLLMGAIFMAFTPAFYIPLILFGFTYLFVRLEWSPKSLILVFFLPLLAMLHFS